MLRVDVKDKSKQKLTIRMFDEQLLKMMKVGVVVEIYHIVVSNFPNVEKKPYFLQSTPATTVVIATKEEQKEFDYIVAEDDNICGKIVGIEHPKFYDSCPSCFTKVRNPAHHVWNINGRVGYLCHVCSVIFVPPYKDFKFDVLVKDDDGNVRTVVGFKRYIQDFPELDTIPHTQMEEFLNFELVGKDGKDQDLRAVSAEEDGFLLAYPIAPHNNEEEMGNGEDIGAFHKESYQRESGTTSVACSSCTEQTGDDNGSILQSPFDQRPKTPNKTLETKEAESNGTKQERKESRESARKESRESTKLIRSDSYIKSKHERPTTAKNLHDGANGNAKQDVSFDHPHPIATEDYYKPMFKP